jgi:hypothetical protein
MYAMSMVFECPTPEQCPVFNACLAQADALEGDKAIYIERVRKAQGDTTAYPTDGRDNTDQEVNVLQPVPAGDSEFIEGVVAFDTQIAKLRVGGREVIRHCIKGVRDKRHLLGGVKQECQAEALPRGMSRS